MKIIKPFLDYYEILQLPPDADREQIRQRYLETAQNFHPDRIAKSTRKEKQYFQEVSEAYSVLKNTHKREQYDQKRKIYLNRSRSKKRFCWQKFISFFKSTAPKNDENTSQKPLIVPLRIQKLEAIFGGEKKIALKYKRPCPQALSGEHRKQDGECHVCSGKGTVLEQKNITLQLPPGLKEGQRLRLSKNKFPQLRGTDAPIMLELQIASDPFLRVIGLDLEYTCPVSFEKMLLRDIVSICFNDKRYKVQIPSGQLYPDCRVRIPGEGLRANEKVGDLVVKLVMEFPSKISPEQKDLLQQFSRLSADNKKNREKKELSSG